METSSPSREGISDWSTLRRGQRVAFNHDSDGPVAGVVEMRTDDASVLWIQLNEGAGRRLIHCEDGYRLKRAD
ncbi:MULTISPECIES: hypothetical protein [unclassified Arthrobacter]|uniref:hypothetical protein n=1 Tax=unclassified Arthrobacter TaxID=235627 RepID=UPI0002D555C6|nr:MULTISPECIES: hypothetical protein [unclassified Arthrobacter]PVE16923.1 hypothetical protein DDA93_11875 [Arthrobacter sp. Bz4]